MVPTPVDVKCEVCGSSEWIACEPGEDDGAALRAWCREHWPWLLRRKSDGVSVERRSDAIPEGFDFDGGLHP